MAAQLAQVTVVGTLTAAVQLRLRARGARDVQRQTVLHGCVRDAAALLGLLERTAALGLELVAVRRAPARRAVAAGVEVQVVVAGGVGDVALSMLDELEDRRRVPCTTVAVRADEVEDTVAWLEGRGCTVLATSVPLPPVAGDAAAEGADESERRVATDLTARAAVRGRREEGTVDVLSDTDEELGPIDYLVVEFPSNRLDGSAFPLLVDLVERGIIRVMDFVFVSKSQDGTVSGLELHDVAPGGTDLAVLEGASSGLLGTDDVAEAAQALENGSAAGILVYENRWAAPFAAALRRGGGQLVASGRIPVQAVLAALDALDAA